MISDNRRRIDSRTRNGGAALGRIKAPWESGSIGSIATYVVAGAALIAAIVILGDEIGHHIASFEAWIESQGSWAMVLFVLLYAILSSAFFPETLLGIVAGASFGFTRGLALVACGNLAGMALQYFLASHRLQPVIDRALASRPSLAAIQSAVLQQQLRLQLLIRLTPINRAMTSYVLGAAGVSFSRFMLAGMAILPNLCLEVYFGYAGKHLAKVAGQSGHTATLHDAALFVGLVFAIIALVSVSRMARRAVDEATAAATAGSGGASGLPPIRRP